MSEQPITLSFSVSEEEAEAIVEEIADARENGDEEWDFHAFFEIENAAQIQAELQEQLNMADLDEQERQIAEEYESFDP